MPLATITAGLGGKTAGRGRARERRVLKGLKIIYEGGSLDGKSANFPTRGLWCVVVGLHRGNQHILETYERTIWLNLRNRRTIFRCTGVASKSTDSSWWKDLLAVLHIRKLKAITIP